MTNMVIDHRRGSAQGAYGKDKGNDHPKLLLLTARFLSIILHPLFIPAYIGYYLVFVNPYFFVGYGHQEKLWVVLRVINNMVLFPALTVLLLRGLGFIKSIYLKTQRERIIPYVASGIFFFWIYLVFRNDYRIPQVMVSFTFGVFIAASLALIANIYFKVSMHAIGAGGMLGLFLAIIYNYPEATMGLTMSIALLLTGIILTSRLLVSDHSHREIYFGLFLGLACQVVAALIML